MKGKSIDRAQLLKNCYGKHLGEELTDYLLESGFLEKPASISYHGNYPGGLFDHSESVAQVLADLTEKLGLIWERPESPYIVGFCHDLCKLDDYVNDVFKDSFVHNPDKLLFGHGDKSVIMALTQIKLTDEEMYCILYHMGAYETDKWDGFSRAIKNYPNVLYTHTADMIASKIIGV